MGANLPKVVVLRWGHRLRDERVTTHVALTARALGAAGIMLTDVKDEKIRATLSEVVQNWGGTFFFQIGTSFKKAMKCWKAEGGMVVHLTAYGENIEASNVMERIHAAGRDLLVIVGSRKVPAEFFSREISDFNVAVGNQPHSECSSLAVFLDRFFNGKELVNEFENARLEIIPQKHGKKVLSRGRA